MKIKSARYFREKYMTDVRHVQPNTGYNPTFIGCSHKNKNGSYTKGFFDLFHGDKEDVSGFLSGFLKIAEDGQAIYEFLQNAADCGSSLFYLFYNENYFLAVNNGDVFNQAGLRSLLNVTQSTKSTSSQIGRFGIGFKLVHRLVGKGDGMEELTREYKGPIMFSWSKEEDLISLMHQAPIESVNDIDDKSPLPYLIKLLITSFPTEPLETIIDLDFNQKVLFTQKEYSEMCKYVRDCLSNCLAGNDLRHGSLFFIKLGEGKKGLLDNDYKKNLKAGVEYSLNTLKGLEDVKINGNQIKKVPLVIESSLIRKESTIFKSINPEYKDDDIHFSIGYNKIDFSASQPFVSVEALKKSPTFYKYFPLGDEIHQSAIFIHCDSINNEANRRKMHEDSTNKHLIPEIAKFIIQKLEIYKGQNNKDNFCQLYANLILSNAPHDNSDWLKEAYYDIIQEYIIRCIPTENGYASKASNVKIKRIHTNIPLNVVNDNLQWFEWNTKNVEELIEAAKDKIGIKPYDIVDLIINANLKKLNTWIKTADESEYDSLLNELNSTSRSISSNTEFKNKIRQAKLFRFSDGKFYSYNELIEYTDYGYSDTQYTSNNIFTNDKVIDIKNILQSIGFCMSDSNIDDYTKLKNCFVFPKDKHVFSLIATNIERKQLSKEEKRKLILHLATQNPRTKFKGVGKAELESLCFCKNNEGKTMPLYALIGLNYKIPIWLSPYQIKKDDYFTELDNYLMPEAAIYRSIIYEKWDELAQTKHIVPFYNNVKRLYDIESSSNKPLKGKKYVYTEDNEYVEPDDLIFNKKMLNASIKYKELHNFIANVFNGYLPKKSIVDILGNEPFGLENSNLCDEQPDKSNKVNIEDIRAALNFCKLNKETFFNAFVIGTENGAYHIYGKNDSYYQVYATNGTTRSFIEKNLRNTMVPLPNELSAYKDSEGIISGPNLYALIIEQTDDVNNLKEELADIIKGGDARYEFIRKLSEIEINLDETINTDCYIFKIIDMACKSISHKETIQEFRSKLTIVKDGIVYSHNQIPQCVSDNFEMEGGKKKFDIAKILPNENKNASLLIEIADKFTALGIPRSKLNMLFGINDKADIDNIYSTLVENYEVLCNEQQLAFVLLYCDYNDLQLPAYKVYNIDQEAYEGDFTVKAFKFINKTYILSKDYSHLGSYIDLPYKDDIYIETPYINDENQFVAPGLDTKSDSEDDDKTSYSKVISLLEFLNKLYKHSKRKFKDVDWSSIKDELGFDPQTCIYPSQYAIESEQLPKAIERWAKSDNSNRDLLQAMGVLCENSPIVLFRKYMNKRTSTFDGRTLYKVDYLENLQNSLTWLSKKKIFPLSQNRYEVFNIIIERINNLRTSEGIYTDDEIDIDSIKKSCKEYDGYGYKEWKKDTGHSIYLYCGKLPHAVTIDEYIDDVVYKYADKDITTDRDDNIYINQKADIQEAMHLLASNNDIGLTYEHVYQLFDHSIRKLEKEIKTLKNQLQEAKYEVATMGGRGYFGVDATERAQWNEEARKKVKKKLESEGYQFTEGIGSYSNIPGVLDPNGKPVPLVVKSCKQGNMSINPIEWGTLLKPNSMLWIDNGSIHPLHLRDLIRNQDELVLRMDTCNLDDISRVSKLAQILRYFKQIHFDFSSIQPTTIATTYKDYAFDDRPMDEKPEKDDFEP